MVTAEVEHLWSLHEVMVTTVVDASVSVTVESVFGAGVVLVVSSGAAVVDNGQ